MSVRRNLNLRLSAAVFMAAIGMLLMDFTCDAMPADTREVLTKIYAARPIKSADLKVRIQSSQTKVGQSEILDFDVLLENVSATPFYIYGNLQAGESGSLSIWFKKSDTHQDVPSNVIYDAVRPSDIVKEDFLRVPSHYIYGTHMVIKMSDFDFPVSGTYQMIVVYHAPFSSKFISDLRIWGKEFGDVPSNPLQIQVTK